MVLEVIAGELTTQELMPSLLHKSLCQDKMFAIECAHWQILVQKQVFGCTVI